MTTDHVRAEMALPAAAADDTDDHTDDTTENTAIGKGGPR